MKKLKKIESQRKGITLSALVITVIIMLILSGIVINLTIGQDGIITIAQQAGKNQIEAEQKEQGILGDYENLINLQLSNSNREDASVEELKEELENLKIELNNLKSNINQTDAIAEDILSGKKAYTKNGLITGTSTKKYTEAEYQLALSTARGYDIKSVSFPETRKCM